MSILKRASRKDSNDTKKYLNNKRNQSACDNNDEEALQLVAKMLTTIEKQKISKAAMDVESMETSRTIDLWQWLGTKKTFASNTSTNRDLEMNNDAQQEPVIGDNETVVQGSIEKDTHKIRSKVKLTFAAGESEIASCFQLWEVFSTDAKNEW